MTVFDLQMYPTSPGSSLHKLDCTRDKNFWPACAKTDIRIIVHRMDEL